MYSYCFITDVFINSVVTHSFLIHPHQFSGVFRVLKFPQKKRKRKKKKRSVLVLLKGKFLSPTFKSHRQGRRFFAYHQSLSYSAGQGACVLFLNLVEFNYFFLLYLARMTTSTGRLFRLPVRFLRVLNV